MIFAVHEFVGLTFAAFILLTFAVDTFVTFLSTVILVVD